MHVAPTPDGPPETDDAKLAKPVPLCQPAHGEVVLIAITPAVAALARVARSILEERRARRLPEPLRARELGQQGPAERRAPQPSAPQTVYDRLSRVGCERLFAFSTVDR
jgi:hypothetical protein